MDELQISFNLLNVNAVERIGSLTRQCLFVVCVCVCVFCDQKKKSMNKVTIGKINCIHNFFEMPKNNEESITTHHIFIT